MLWYPRHPWLTALRLPDASTLPLQMATKAFRQARSSATSTLSSTTMRRVGLQRVQSRMPLDMKADRDPSARAPGNTASPVVDRALPARPRLRRPHNAARTNRQAMLRPSIASCPGGPRRGRVSAAETTKGTFGSAPTTNAITASRS